MSSRLKLVSVLVLLAAAGLGSFFTAQAQTIGAPTPSSQQVVTVEAPQVWEQSCVSKSVPTPRNASEAPTAALDLDLLVRRNGVAGWELVSSTFTVLPDGTLLSLACFKRAARP
jgi:hypothetical protein